MRSIFKELEDNLYNVINAAPLTVEAKYYIVKGVFQSLADAYQQWLNMEEPQPEVEEEEEIEVTREESDDGRVTVKAQGSFDKMQEVIDKTIAETHPELLETEE